MVFTYTVRLPGVLQSAICYMGLDKHENELLISSGVPTDVWFHVDDLSSAHVYLRLPSTTPPLTLDSIPPDTMEDLCQLVKANSIKGSKMNNVKVVYTPWGNLRKDLVGMDVGTVGFKDDAQCRYRRVVKDRAIVNRIEKTKTKVKWDYWEVKRVWEEAERLRVKASNKAKYLSSSSSPPPKKKNIQMYDAIMKTPRFSYSAQSQGQRE